MGVTRVINRHISLLIPAACCLVICALTACGSGGSSGTPAATGPGPSVGTTIGLPDAATVLAAVREVSSSQCLSRTGSEYQAELPADAVTVVNGDELEFSPDWTREQGGELAFAIYSLNPGQGLPVGLDLTWASTGDGYTAWAGLLDHGGECWDFHVLDEAGDCTLEDARDYIDPATEEVLVLVVVTGTRACRLAVVSLQVVQPEVPGWPMFGQNPSRTFRTAVAGPQTPQARWTFDLGVGECRSPAVVSAEGIVYIVGSDRLHAFDGATGEELWWRVDNGFRSYAPVVGATNIVTVGGSDYAIATARDGSPAGWTTCQAWLNTPVGDWSGSTVAALDIRSAPFIELLDEASLDTIAQVDLPGDGGIQTSCGLTVTTAGAYIVRGRDGLYKYTPEGDQVWALLGWSNDNESRVSFFIHGLPCLSPQNRIYCFGYDAVNNDSGLYAIDAGDGAVCWHSPLTPLSCISPGILSDGRIIVQCYDNVVRCLNPADGSLSWEVACQTEDYASASYRHIAPAIDGNDVTYVGCQSGRLLAVNPDGTEKWSYYCGEPPCAGPAIGPDGTIYLATTAGILHAVGEMGGPVAVVAATPRSGDAPLGVTFDCSASQGHISSYDFDWDGDGTWDLTSATAIKSHTYEAGTWDARVRVVNTAGVANVLRLTVHAGPLTTEIEPNDTPAEAALWPALACPLYDFTGYADGQPSDGQSPDYFRLTAEAGQRLTILTNNHDGYGWRGTFLILDAGLETLFEKAIEYHEPPFYYDFSAEDAGPFLVLINGNWLDAGEYSFSFTLTEP